MLRNSAVSRHFNFVLDNIIDKDFAAVNGSEVNRWFVSRSTLLQVQNLLDCRTSEQDTQYRSSHEEHDS